MAEIRKTSGVNSRFVIRILSLSRHYVSSRRYVGSMITVRLAGTADAGAIWEIIEPAIRAGETYTLPRDMTQKEAFAYWFAPGHEVFVAEEIGKVVGTYFLHA